MPSMTTTTLGLLKRHRLQRKMLRNVSTRNWRNADRYDALDDDWGSASSTAMLVEEARDNCEDDDEMKFYDAQQSSPDGYEPPDPSKFSRATCFNDEALQQRSEPARCATPAVFSVPQNYETWSAEQTTKPKKKKKKKSSSSSSLSSSSSSSSACYASSPTKTRKSSHPSSSSSSSSLPKLAPSSADYQHSLSSPKRPSSRKRMSQPRILSPPEALLFGTDVMATDAFFAFASSPAQEVLQQPELVPEQRDEHCTSGVETVVSTTTAVEHPTRSSSNGSSSHEEGTMSQSTESTVQSMVLVDKIPEGLSRTMATNANGTDDDGVEVELVTACPDFDEEDDLITAPPDIIDFEDDEEEVLKVEVQQATVETTPKDSSSSSLTSSVSKCTATTEESSLPPPEALRRRNSPDSIMNLQLPPPPPPPPSPPRRRVRFADEAGKPIHTIHYAITQYSEEDLQWVRTIVLLMSPKNRKFEFIHLSYNVEEKTSIGNDVLMQIRAFATDSILANQTYVGLCRAKDERGVPRELINSVSIQSYYLSRDEILVAIVEGYSGKTLLKLAKPLLENKKILRAVKKAKAHGQAVQRLRSSPPPSPMVRTKKKTSDYDSRRRDHEKREGSTIVAACSKKNRVAPLPKKQESSLRPSVIVEKDCTNTFPLTTKMPIVVEDDDDDCLSIPSVGGFDEDDRNNYDEPIMPDERTLHKELPPQEETNKMVVTRFLNAGIFTAVAVAISSATGGRSNVSTQKRQSPQRKRAQSPWPSWGPR